MIELLTGFPEGVLGFVYKGQVTKADFDDVLTPAVEKTLATHQKVRVYSEIAPDFAGFDAGAVWEDLKVGIGHFNAWERVAVVTDVKWIEETTQFVGFLSPAEMKTFPASEAAQAKAWIAAETSSAAS